LLLSDVPLLYLESLTHCPTLTSSSEWCKLSWAEQINELT